ncbi:guanine nucleotide-binding protein subunit gamma 3 [Helianthus annuus]|uniref:guanine nucleotide-binding protein subunit gamma 3 n=1 Tax=Helianthus annuus TaxID=4232 RepID=UPI000B903989|nr:guanine nucleotide-binding protein subunit gamma 3 [Helianthus annuus]
MAGTSNDSSSSSISPLSSPSSIVFVDLYGKRRQVAKVQVLEREIGLLQDEIKSLAELEVASRCCKELEDYVEATPDPLVVINQVRGRSRSCWKNLWRKIGSVLRCCCCCGCCNTKDRCACFSCAKGCCCWGGRKKTCSSGCCKCPELTCNCCCNPTCPKCSVCCCCNPCSCF